MPKNSPNPLTTERHFRCGCGSFQAKLQGEPLFVMDCHCHSCVSTARYIDKKACPNGHSISCLSKETGGASVAMYLYSNVEFPSSSKTRFGFVKVGPRGTRIRRYLKCCNTMAFGISEKLVTFNRNCIYNKNGTKYKLEAKPVNCIKKFAFDPEKVPEPSNSYIPFLGFLSIFLAMLNPFDWPKEDEDKLHTHYNHDLVEVVPITWE